VCVHFGEKILDSPHENSRIPQKAIADHPLGRGAIGLLDEPRHAPRAIDDLTRLDVAESWIRTRGHHTDGDQRGVLLRDARRSLQGRSKFAFVADRPVGVHAKHYRGIGIPSLDLEGRPGERGPGARGARLGDDILRRECGERRLHRLGEARVRDDEGALGRYRGCQAPSGVDEEGRLIDEGKELLRSLRSGQGPEA
jgi:hypothetical protein